MTVVEKPNMGKGSRSQTRKKRNRRTSDTHNAANVEDVRAFQQDARHAGDDDEGKIVLPEEVEEKPTVIEVELPHPTLW